LIWLAKSLKLEVTNYSRELYGPSGVAHLVVAIMMMVVARRRIGR